MTSRDERDAQGDSPRETEDLMQEAPPSVLEDVEDAVTPDVEGELTPWSPRGRDAEDGEA